MGKLRHRATSRAGSQRHPCVLGGSGLPEWVCYRGGRVLIHTVPNTHPAWCRAAFLLGVDPSPEGCAFDCRNDMGYIYT